MKTYLQCRCSSIRACGERVVVLPASLTNFRGKLDQRIPIYQISENYPISSVASLSINRVCEQCYDIICSSCGAKFRIFIHGHKNFLQFPLMGKDPNKTSHETSVFISTCNSKEKELNIPIPSRHKNRRPKQQQPQVLNAVIVDDNADLPIPLRSFILMKKVNKEQEKKDEFINYADDDDFDLMFSNSKESLVGSFHNVSLGIHDLSLLS